MEIQELEAQARPATGKGAARKLRARGRIPAVCYRKGKEAFPLSVDEKKFERVLHTAAGQNVLIQLDIQGPEGTRKTVILKDIQRHPLAGVLHVDFLEVLLDEAIVVEVPLRIVGEPVDALRAGGLVQQLRRSLEVKCLPTRIPDHLTVDVSSLNLGESLHVEDVKVDGEILIVTDPKEPIVVISAPEQEKAEVAEAPAEGAEEAGTPSQGAASGAREKKKED